MGVISRLHSDIEELSKRYLTASKSIKRRIINDFEYADSLAERLDIKLQIPNYKVSYKDFGLYMNQVDECLMDFEGMADVIIGMFKEMDFYSFYQISHEYMSKHDQELLMSEFLDYFLKDLFSIYQSLIKDDRVIIGDLGSNLGESFFLNQINSHYIVLSPNNKSGYIMLETIIHELCHIYSAIFMKNYRYSGQYNLDNGFFGETISLYSELSLYEFLKKKCAIGVGGDLQRNLVDYYILTYFKTIKYLCEMAKRVDTSFRSNNVEYWVDGNNRLIVDNDTGMYSYPEFYSNGSLLDVRYALSTIEAFNLLERERNGENPKKIINEFLISCQNDSQLDDFLDSYIDLDFMFNTIKDRNVLLKNKLLSPKK